MIWSKHRFSIRALLGNFPVEILLLDSDAEAAIVGGGGVVR